MPRLKLVHRSPVLAGNSLQTPLVYSRPAIGVAGVSSSLPQTQQEQFCKKAATPIKAQTELLKIQRLDKEREELERSYGSKSPEESYARYDRYLTSLQEYKKEKELAEGNGGGGRKDFAWREFTWMSSSAKHLDFELCTVTYCAAVYKYGSIKNWLRTKGEKLLLDLEEVIYFRIEDAYSLSSAMRPRKDRIKDKSFSYYATTNDNNNNNNESNPSTTRILSKEEKEELKQQVEALCELAVTFKLVAEKMLPPANAGDSFQFPYVGEDLEDDIYVAPPPSSFLRIEEESEVGGTGEPHYFDLTTRAWSEEFVGTCDRISCLKLYGYCSLLAASLVHLLLSQLYFSSPCSSSSSSGAAVGGGGSVAYKVDRTVEDFQKSKALLEHVLYVERKAKTLPVRLPLWENRLSALCLIYYARYTFDARFRCDVAPTSNGGFDGYGAHKEVAKTLAPLNDRFNVRAVYSTRRSHYGYDGGGVSDGEGSTSLRLEAALRTMENYCDLIIKIRYSSTTTRTTTITVTADDRVASKSFLCVPFSPVMMSLLNAEIASFVVRQPLPENLTTLDRIERMVHAATTTTTTPNPLASGVTDVVIYKIGLLALWYSKGPPPGWTDVLGTDLPKLMKDSRSPNVETLYDSLIKPAIEKEMIKHNLHRQQRK